MNTSKSIARLLILADRHQAPASYVAFLWRLRAEPVPVQAARLRELEAELLELHHGTA